jgi:uncharacterized protein (DUF697 family)
VNRTALLHIVERLEGLLGKLPGAIQKPVLHELTPLKELFLQQRLPRFLVAGAGRLPMPQIVNLLFNGETPAELPKILSEVFRWQTLEIKNRGAIALLDARGADDEAEDTIREELGRQSADAILVISDAAEGRTKVKRSAENGNQCVHWNDRVHSNAGIVAIHFNPTSSTNRNGRLPRIDWFEKIKPELHGRFWGGFEFSSENNPTVADYNASQQFVSLLARRLPNDCRVEIVRISNDREAQREIASVLIKSTTAICTAIGAQPIPLADLPILTTLQLVMVSGIMYLSGRPRSLRAATEFVGALGANVGAGMLLREGARALLKFIPGWGNVVCGMVAGAGTYAIGHAASAYFLEGVTLHEARRTYLKGRKRKKPPMLQLR